MCNHSYTADYAQMPRTMGKRCPYPEFYEKARSIASSAREADRVPALPMDGSGVCIFHSQDVAWKRNNDFKGSFLRLVQLLNADEAAKHYDFAEFVFVGSELRTADGAEQHTFRIADISFLKQAYFIGASFLDAFTIEHVDFTGGAEFREATFADDLRIANARFCGLNFAKAKLRQHASFTTVEFANYALFDNAQFTGTTIGHVVTFKDSRFDGITSFSRAAFILGDESSVAFLGTRFEDAVDFGRTQFHCPVIFSDVSFAGTTEFIDTSFDTVKSSARYRGSAVEFNRIEVTAAGVLTFRSTDPQNKMFHHDVQMSFEEDPVGLIRFENVSFSKIASASRDRLTRLAKSGKVEIGSGCIKYRFQTGVRTLPVSQDNAPLVIELCQTFTNYFTVSNGLNLGFEIVDRSKTQLSFFYFTDEDISEAIFLDRLAETEQSLWSLLSTRSNMQLLGAEVPASEARSAGKENAVINAVDGISALIVTFFRVGIRIGFGTWKQHDTKALLDAIRFNDDEEGAERRALSLHQVMVDKYTGRTLLEINMRQNVGLPRMVVRDRQIDFAILTAIEVERRAVCAAFGLDEKDRIKKDGRVYWRGQLPLPNGQVYQFVVTQPFEMGNVEAALVAAEVIHHWSPSAALLIGIAASTDPDKVKLGDVVVGKSVWYYEHGKVTPQETKPQPEMIQADSGLLKHLAGLPDWEGTISVSRPDGTYGRPQLHQGVIASGEKVIADTAVRDQIASGHRKILALEMEGYGFSRAVWQSFERVRHLVIRGICDDGSPTKDDRWHGYAASAAAAFARHFVLDRPL